MAAENSFAIGDSVKVKEKAWEGFSHELYSFGFEEDEAYEVTGLYDNGSSISLKGARAIYYSKYFELAKTEAKEVAPIKSDGGSSSYYDIELPHWFVQLIVDRADNKGKAFIKTEELIEVLFKSDFDYANIQKALVRSFGAQNGAGKEGNDVDYEQNKIQYSSNRIKERAKR
jgi:hypothetical protein